MPLYMGYAKIWVLESNNENLLKGYTMDRVSTMRIGMILISLAVGLLCGILAVGVVDTYSMFGMSNVGLFFLFGFWGFGAWVWYRFTHGIRRAYITLSFGICIVVWVLCFIILNSEACGWLSLLFFGCFVSMSVSGFLILYKPLWVWWILIVFLGVWLYWLWWLFGT